MPMDASRYPPNWRQISLAVRKAANWRCQRCGIKHGEVTAKARQHGGAARVVLTVAHLGPNKHDKMDISNLAALCQSCHLAEDMPEHVANARATRTRKRTEAARAAGQQELFREDTEG